MSWNVIQVELDYVPIVLNKLDIDIRNGNPILTDLRCIYTVEEESDKIIHLLSAFDFLDLNPRSPLKSFHLGQMVKN